MGPENQCGQRDAVDLEVGDALFNQRSGADGVIRGCCNLWNFVGGLVVRGGSGCELSE